LSDEEMTNIKVVDLDELFSFGIHHFFSWNHLGFQTNETSMLRHWNMVNLQSNMVKLEFGENINTDPTSNCSTNTLIVFVSHKVHSSITVFKQVYNETLRKWTNETSMLQHWNIGFYIFLKLGIWAR
jgi:hypothetical protein